MALTLSESYRTYIQKLTGIGSAELVIDNDFLDFLYDYESGDMNSTIASVWEAIAADQAKLVTYSNGLQSENLSDLLDHVLLMAKVYRDKVNVKNQFRNVALRPTPIKYKDKPWTELRGARYWPRGRGRWNEG